MRVLVVEDEKKTASFIRKALQAENYAVDVCHQPGGTIDAALKRDSLMAELVVSKTGPGVSPEILPRVFDPFFRGEPARNRGIEGCGVGIEHCAMDRFNS